MSSFTALRHNITIQQGSLYQLCLLWRDESGDPIDLTGWQARMQVRASHTSSVLLAEATTANGLVVLGGASGTIDVTLPSAVTAVLPASRLVYDLELIRPSDSEPQRFVEGFATVTPEVTRDG